jgi:hypothetical protein
MEAVGCDRALLWREAGAELRAGVEPRSGMACGEWKRRQKHQKLDAEREDARQCHRLPHPRIQAKSTTRLSSRPGQP